MKELKKRIVFQISEKKHTDIKTAAAAMRKTMKTFISDAIEFFISEEKKKRK